MNPRIVRIGLATAGLALVVLLGLNLVREDRTAALLTSTPTPTLTATPTPSLTATPTATPTRDVFGTEVHNGRLDPGTYAYLDIDAAGFNVSFVVPAGWTWSGRYLSKGGAGPPDGGAIFFFGGPVDVYSDPCRWAGAHEPGTPTARILVADLAAQASRSATSPIDRPYGSGPAVFDYPGTSVVLTVPKGINFANCDLGEFRTWGPEQKARSAQGPGQRDFVWAVDAPGSGVDNGSGVIDWKPGGLIVDAASFPGTPADVMSEIDAILNSIYIGHWG